jgi:Branched-chain amino acid transport system / permease component
MIWFLQNVIDAISLGSLYALAALGIGLLFGVLRLINFAHGDFISVGAYALIVPPLQASADVTAQMFIGRWPLPFMLVAYEYYCDRIRYPLLFPSPISTKCSRSLNQHPSERGAKTSIGRVIRSLHIAPARSRTIQWTARSTINRPHSRGVVLAKVLASQK